MNDLLSFWPGDLSQNEQLERIVGSKYWSVKKDDEQTIYSFVWPRIDGHLHARQGEMMELVLPEYAKKVDAMVLMPNTNAALRTWLPTGHIQFPEQVDTYKKQAQGILERKWIENYAGLLMTASFTEDMTPERIRILDPMIFGIKMYPAGKTTWSEDAPDIWECIRTGKFDDSLRKMESLGIPLLIHGETSEKRDTEWYVISGEQMYAEEEFVEIYEMLVERFPHLIIVAEHMSTEKLANLVSSTEYKYRNLFGSITPQHCWFSYNDVHKGSKWNDVRRMMMPVIKETRHQRWIHRAMLSNPWKVYKWTDNAPHDIQSKVLGVSCCANGAFSLHADEHFLRFFESKGQLELFPGFIGGNFANIHAHRLERLGIRIPTKEHHYIRRAQNIPFTLEWHGQTIHPWDGKEQTKWTKID